jgi:hypothetical protein
VTQYYRDHVGSVPRGDYVEIRYEDFCTAPGPTIQHVLDFLGLKSACPPTPNAIVQPRKTVVLPEILQQYRRMRAAIAPYCAKHGYDVEASFVR